MSLKGFFSGQSDDGNPMKASEALLHHVNGTGTGYEVDDLLTWSPTPEQERKAILPLHEINDRYSCDEYPIGIANPASFDEIRMLAERLRSEGL